MTMGLIVGNRGFFPITWRRADARKCSAFWRARAWMWSRSTPEESKYGAVETREESRRCAELFKKNRERIDGVIVTLPNFGEERAIADTLRLADLRVPVLIQATPDEPAKMSIAARRDSFCGKMSACNNLKQYGIPYSITTLHTEAPDSPEFAQRPRVVLGGMSGGEGIPESACGSDWCAADGVQYGSLQREDPGVEWHLHRDAGSFRSAGPHRAHERR